MGSSKDSLCMLTSFVLSYVVYFTELAVSLQRILLLNVLLSHIVAQKTIPIFGHYGKIGLP
jgi:hypothetical protein